MCGVNTAVDITPYITMFGGGIIAGLSAYFVGIRMSDRAHRNTIDLMQRQEFNRAATTFRSNIINELAGLYPIPVNWPDDIDNRLSATFPKIQAAVEEFKPFVTDSSAFNEAWLQYYTHCNQVIPRVFSLANRLRGTESTQDARDEFKHNVDNLLSFAKEK